MRVYIQMGYIGMVYIQKVDQVNLYHFTRIISTLLGSCPSEPYIRLLTDLLQYRPTLSQNYASKYSQHTFRVLMNRVVGQYAPVANTCIKSHIFRSPTFSGDEEYKCVLCDKSWKTANSLLQHNAAFHGEKNNPDTTCRVCGFVTYKGNMKVHMRIHEQPMFSCDVCGKQLKSKYSLNDHRRQHTGESPFRYYQQSVKLAFIGIWLSCSRVLIDESFPIILVVAK